MEVQKSHLVSRIVKDFLAMQGATQSDLIAKINQVLLQRAWFYVNRNPEVTALELILEWNKTTVNGDFNRENVDKYISALQKTGKGTSNQKMVANAVKLVMKEFLPSLNQPGGLKALSAIGGNLNRLLISRAWHYKKYKPNISEEELVSALISYTESVIANPELVNYKKASNNAIEGQDKVKLVCKDAIEILKTTQFIPTKLAGLINAVAWKLYKANMCTVSNLLYYIDELTCEQIQEKLKANINTSV